MAGAGDRKTVMLVDGFGLIFRAYHALPPSMTTTSGEQTNAVFGFASMLLDTINQRKPDYAIVVWDHAGGKQRRRTVRLAMGDKLANSLSERAAAGVAQLESW